MCVRSKKSFNNLFCFMYPLVRETILCLSYHIHILADNFEAAKKKTASLPLHETNLKFHNFTPMAIKHQSNYTFLKLRSLQCRNRAFIRDKI